MTTLKRYTLLHSVGYEEDGAAFVIPMGTVLTVADDATREIERLDERCSQLDLANTMLREQAVLDRTEIERLEAALAELTEASRKQLEAGKAQFDEMARLEARVRELEQQYGCIHPGCRHPLSPNDHPLHGDSSGKVESHGYITRTSQFYTTRMNEVVQERDRLRDMLSEPDKVLVQLDTLQRLRGLIGALPLTEGNVSSATFGIGVHRVDDSEARFRVEVYGPKELADALAALLRERQAMK